MMSTQDNAGRLLKAQFAAWKDTCSLSVLICFQIVFSVYSGASIFATRISMSFLCQMGAFMLAKTSFNSGQFQCGLQYLMCVCVLQRLVRFKEGLI